MYNDQDQHLSPRRTFISTTLKAAGAISLLSVNEPLNAADLWRSNKEYTVQDIIDLILKEIPGAPFKETVDTLKSGDGNIKVTGIVTTMFTTVDIIRQAVKLKANFIIAHEPTFYNHNDDPKWVEPNDIVKKKQDLLKEHNITVWRFHDYWHAYRPDGILNGVLKKAGWQQYSKSGEIIVTIPGMSLDKIVTHLKSSLKIQKVKVIGDLSQQCKRIALLPGACGGQRQVSAVENEKPDLLIVGELQEWETAEYIRDARSFGKNISLIILGHAVSEEPGMEWLAEWLQPELDVIKVSHIASGDPFKWI